MVARRPPSLLAYCVDAGQIGLTKDTGNRIAGKSWTEKVLCSHFKELLLFCNLLREIWLI